jgi:hypothetical protein
MREQYPSPISCFLVRGNHNRSRLSPRRYEHGQSRLETLRKSRVS